MAENEDDEENEGKPNDITREDVLAFAKKWTASLNEEESKPEPFEAGFLGLDNAEDMD